MPVEGDKAGVGELRRRAQFAGAERGRRPPQPSEMRLDRIETLYGNALLNRIRARRGDTIYHCVYCRLQFYDPHKPSFRAEKTGKSGEKQAAPEKTEPEPARTLAAVAGVNRTVTAALPSPAPRTNFSAGGDHSRHYPKR